MIDFGIPNDSLKFRRSIFKELMTPDELTGYSDGATDYNLLLAFNEDNQPDVETRLWMAFLYGMSYSCTTVLRFVTEFPTIADIQPRKVKLWREKSCLLKFRFPDLVNKNRGCLVWTGYAYPKLFTVYQSERKLKVFVA